MSPLTRIGTRFRLFPEYASGYWTPETVLLSPRPGSIGPGPSDAQMYVANAVDKTRQYEPPGYMPPYRGPEFVAAHPDRFGHFDCIALNTPQFLSAHIYGTARHTLDIWEGYLGRRVEWWHAPAIPRLELVPIVHWANAHSGPGFLETGLMRNNTGRDQPFCLNFDVIAHEVGHAILFSQIGVPAPDLMSSEYLALHESFADLTGLIGALNFRSVTEKLLMQTEGNLYVLNIVSRMGKISDTEQIRIASNTKTMADVQGLHLEPDGNWFDPLGQNRNQHALGEPLTGAIFDILVEIYQDRLVALGVVPRTADTRGWTRAEVEASLHQVHGVSARAFRRFSRAFHAALIEARDVVGRSMAHVMTHLHPEAPDFDRIAALLLEAAVMLGEGRNVTAMLNHFLWHGIDPRPYLTRDARFADPVMHGRPLRREAAAFIAAQRHMRHLHREVPR
jgi:hypothetical protein